MMQRLRRLMPIRMQDGMTLVELIVVLGIVAVVSAVLVFNYSSFRTTVTLRSLSQQIALSVRKAQTYATSVRGIEGLSQSTTAFPAYGIAFSIDPASGPDETAEPSSSRFVLFADVTDGGVINSLYDRGDDCGSPEDGSECVESFGITTPDRVVRLETENGLNVEPIDGEVDIIFNRPAPDASICMVSSGICLPISNLRIVIQSQSGQERVVTVWNTGQISVQ